MEGERGFKKRLSKKMRQKDNSERSHAGPTASNCNRDPQPALAGAFGSVISWSEHLLGLAIAGHAAVSARWVLARVLLKVAYVELLSATGALVAKCLTESQPPARHILDAARSASSTDNDVGVLEH
jgi:hypothetical protein